MSGPLTGYTIVELQGIGPGPFCGMLLSDMGAEVIRIDRSANVRDGDDAAKPSSDLLARGRKSLAVDLKVPEGVETVLRVIEQADGLIEGFRPGVMERLGLGPDVCLARNPRLVYGRMTGWGQEGPYAQAAGHDINYIALAGCLAHIGRPGEAPVPPLNLVGDFGGGGMLLAVGVLCGLLETQRSGKGQVVDAAMVDGAAMLMTAFHAAYALGSLRERGANRLDGGAHFYDVYQCSDGEYISVGSIEPQFYAELRRLAGLDGPEWDAQGNRRMWPDLKEKLAEIFLTKSRDEWCAIMDATDVCFAPVLSIPEAYEHPHNVARNTFVEVGGFRQPAPAPRFSRTAPEIAGPPTRPGEHTDEVLARFGFGSDDIGQLRKLGAVC